MTSPSLLPALLARQAAERPDGPALVCGTETLTYHDWERRSTQLGWALRSRGIARGERVALVFDNETVIDYAVALLGVAKSGAVAVVVPGGATSPECRELVDRGEARLTIVGTARDPGVTPADSLRDLEQAGSSPHTPLSPDPGDLAEIICTSGTTGKPRLVAATHADLLHDHGPFTPAPREPSFIVHAHSLGTNAAQVTLRAPITLGKAVVTLGRFDPCLLCERVQSLRAREVVLSPAMAHELLAFEAAAGCSLGSVERLTMTGAHSPESTLIRLRELFPAATVYDVYTTTEAWPSRVMTEVGAAPAGSVGRPADGAVVIRDEAGRRVPEGTAGAVHLRAAAGARRLLSEAARPGLDGWVDTGDIGRLDSDGHLFIEDRAADRLSPGGHRVSSLEIESVLQEHPAVIEAAVFAVPDAAFGERIAAALRTSTLLTPAAVRAFVRVRLAEHKVPGPVHFVDALPLTRAGKVSKRSLRARFGAGARGPVPSPALRDDESDEERSIRRLWQEVLELDDVTLEDDFLMMGGQSLLAARLAARISAEFAVDVDVAQILRTPTISDQARLVRRLAR